MTDGAAGPVFLVGFMGSGKSTVGRALASALGWAFADTDERVVRRAGKPIPAIFRDDGEAAFRAHEAAVLRGSAAPRTVVATGGGAYLSHANRRWMHHSGRTVWLDVSLEEARRRLGDGAGRPLWEARTPAAQRLLFERRRAAYALAAVRVAVDGAPADLVARRILGKIR